jgi:hypothetical protein
MLESAMLLAVFGLFGFFLAVANSRRVNDLERRLRLLERDTPSLSKELN